MSPGARVLRVQDAPLLLHVTRPCGAQDGGSWLCEVCNQASVPEYRYVLQVTIQDYTGSETVTMFQARWGCLLY